MKMKKISKEGGEPAVTIPKAPIKMIDLFVAIYKAMKSKI